MPLMSKHGVSRVPLVAECDQQSNQWQSRE